MVVKPRARFFVFFSYLCVMIKDISISTTPKTAATPALLITAVAKEAGIPSSEIHDHRVVRRSVDARRHPVKVNLLVRVAVGDDTKIAPAVAPLSLPAVEDSAEVAVIVGAGPAGLFAALEALRLGMRPIVVERGKDVDARRLDLAALCRSGKVDSESNYCFGEGGAGAYSDGKLFTRSKKRGNVAEVLELLVQHGADPDILVDSHPHIGSDKLPEVIRNIRQTIISHGGEVRFSTKMTGLIVDDGKASGIKLEDGGTIMGAGVILATGHSARDVYRMLRDSGVRLEAKGFAMGVRLEHPQQLIDRLQYHSPEGRGKWLPAAEYSFVTQSMGRGVYSFCMCPGGVIVPASSAPGEAVVNGMSASARASQWSNSGMVVEIRPGDIKGEDCDDEFELLDFQESVERRFYEASSCSINAPAQRMTDFVASRDSTDLPRSSYPAGVHPARLDQLLPEFISTRLREGFLDFDRKCRGFLTEQAILVGLESRTSSPVRVPRDKMTLENISVRALYPAGEGAGYAGGIVSAALDGMRCARSLYANAGRQEIQ